MRVHQNYTGSQLRNFSYIVEGAQGHLFIIDPWDGQESIRSAQEIGGLIKGVINTHEHWDHTRGNEEIVKKTSCVVYAHPNGLGKIKEANVFLKEGEKIQVDDETYLEALDTPGHTFAHLCLLLVSKGRPVAVFTGDTLFNAGVGNCHNGGSPEVLFETIEKKFLTLPDEVIVYPGHEYLGNNLGFTLKNEPSNSQAKEWLEKYKKIDWENAPVTTTLKDELEINCFFRLDSDEIIGNLPGSPKTRKEVFLTLRELRNHW
ncbi:MAG: hydroxyacylglutathione hydrolase [Bacteriovoracaceae bacterium]|nr:hydroxyacylglutathione hydrolase [Bacteriovoracaceae bacterium]